MSSVWYQPAGLGLDVSKVNVSIFDASEALLIFCAMTNAQYLPCLYTQIARFMGPKWGPSGADRTQVGSMLDELCYLGSAYVINLLNVLNNSI